MKKADGITRGGIELQLDLGEGLPEICADPGQVELLLLNLLENAHDAMPEGGTVTVRTRLAEIEPASVRAPDPARAGRAFIAISVSDTGKGMDRATLEHIFEPFFTTRPKDKSRRSKGLGLSAVYGIAKQHNGWVEVANQEGTGAEFLVYLPVKAP